MKGEKLRYVFVMDIQLNDVRVPIPKPAAVVNVMRHSNALRALDVALMANCHVIRAYEIVDEWETRE
jgi:hypothetical protein